MNIVIRNGHLVDPANGINGINDIYISDGKIAAIANAPDGFSIDDDLDEDIDNDIDACGQYVFPGLIDLCARLREPGEEHKATIESETRAAVSAGITRMVCPPDTFPIIDTPAMVHMIQNRADDIGYAKVHPLGALTVNLQGQRLTDMAMLMDAGCVGVSNALETVENTLLMRRAMQYASTYGLPIFLTPKDKWLQGNGVVHEGAVSTRLGLPAIPEAAETVGVARDLALIETSGALAHFDLISCRRSVIMIAEAQRRGLPVTAGVAIHHLLCCENDIGAFDTQYKVMPPLRTEQDKAGLIAAVAEGQIAAICSDHQPHGVDAKLAPFSEAAIGIAGIDTLLPLTLSLIGEDNPVAADNLPPNQLTLPKAIAALTINPAKIIGIDSGHLAVGARADLCLFDANKKWQMDEHSMQSKGRNSPFIGKQIIGKVTRTLINGKTVFNSQARE